MAHQHQAGGDADPLDDGRGAHHLAIDDDADEAVAQHGDQGSEHECTHLGPGGKPGGVVAMRGEVGDQHGQHEDGAPSVPVQPLI